MSGIVVRRKETPDFNRFLKVVRRQGDRRYVPFWEMVIHWSHFEPVSGLPLPPGGLEFWPTSPKFEASFAYYLKWCAQVGFDHGIINMPGFGGFPAKRHGVDNPARSFVTSADSVIHNEADFDAYPWPSAKTINVDMMERLAKNAPEGLGLVTGGDAIFQNISALLGYTQLGILLYENPDLVQRVVDRIGAILVETYGMAAGLPFIRGILVSGDMGFKTGTFFSPADLRRLVFPWHKKICDAVHARGKLCILHSCGNLAAVMEDLIACGYDAKHSFEDAITPSFFDLQRQYGKRICLMGGIDVDFLCKADEAALRARVRKTIDALAPDGGYILGSGNSIPDYVPSEKYAILLDEGLKYGRT